MKRPLRNGLAVAPVVGLGTVLLHLPTGQWALLLDERIRDSGPAGGVAYAVSYVVATLLLLPGSILTAGAGFAYGPLWGTLLVWPVSLLASTLAFLLGRFAGRAWVQRRLEQHPRFAAVDAAMGEGGFKIVFLLRLSPIIPYSVLNYALGVTRVRLRDYFLASSLGMLPGTFLYVYLGSTITSASELVRGERPSAGMASHLLYWGGLAATVLATVLITRTARRALDRTLERGPSALVLKTGARR
jgi:uncharacterized membrane protein YdjX (TVP38/TMEM64 family)